MTLKNVFCTLLVALSMVSSSACDKHQKESTTIGYMTSFRLGMGKVIAGAIPLAVDYVNDRTDLLPNHTITYLTADTQKPYSHNGLKAMLSFKNQGVHAFIGKEETCTSEALFASALNLPMITYKCTETHVSRKDYYTTFARTLPPSSKISKSIIALLNYYKWKKVTLVVSDSPTDLQIRDEFTNLAQNNSITINGKYSVKKDYLTKNKERDVRDMVKKSCENTRIYILITEIHVAMDVAMCLYEIKKRQFYEYALIAVEDEGFFNPIKRHQLYTDEKNIQCDSKQCPIKSLFMITPTQPTNSLYSKFSEHVINRTKEVLNTTNRTLSTCTARQVPMHHLIKPQVPFYAGLAYDSMVVYATALHKTLNEGGSITDGAHVMRHIFNQTYDSILGFTNRIDSNGDADGNYSLLILNISDSIKIGSVGLFDKVKDSDLPELRLTAEINWVNYRIPRDEPVCGFDGQKCQFQFDPNLIAGLVLFCMVLSALVFLLLRHLRFEQKLARKLWKVDFNEILVLNLKKDQTNQEVKNAIANFKKEADNQYAINIQVNNTFLEGKDGIGFYRGNMIFISKVHRKTVDITRAMCKELIQLHEMRNENINPFIGISLESNNICIFTMYCERGSLQDVLRNEDLHMDNMFIASLVADLIKGLIYLHYSENMSHGNLKSSNCLVDSRWVLQITGFGLDEFRSACPTKLLTKKQKASLLWKSPETLRKIRLEIDTVFNSNIVLKHQSLSAKRKADIYAFGMILFEIVSRVNTRKYKGPWGDLLDEHELQPEHSYFRNSSNLIKRLDHDFDDAMHIHRSFSDSVNNRILNYESSCLKSDDSTEVSSICLGLEFKKEFLTQQSLTSYDQFNKMNKANNKIKDLARQVAIVRPKEQSICQMDDSESIRLNQIKKRAIDSLLLSKKSLDERGHSVAHNPMTTLKIEEIVDRVKNPAKYGLKLFRPHISSLKDCPQYVASCIRLCWDEKPDNRPDMKQINLMLRQLQSGLKSNIFDNMISMLEKHASNLEELVEERTKQLVEEKKKTENLLLRMLPKSVADQLKRGQKVKAEAYENVTVFFSDIVGFTELSFQSTPFQVVNLLNDLYTCFDEIIGSYDVYKVETIGDAYMVVSGISTIIKEVSKRHHSVEIALMALDLLDAIRHFEIKHRPGEKLKLRIGLHSGPVVGGVVGLKMPRFCLFGDTVNIASRMESTGESLKIHISESCKKNLDQYGSGEFIIEPKDHITYIKGIGDMQTYFLLGRKKQEDLPSCPPLPN